MNPHETQEVREGATSMKYQAVLAACVVLFGTTLHGQTVTLFSDNFESYTVGTNLSGQGGWTGCGSIPIGTSSALPTQVARVDLGSAGCTSNLAGFAWISRSFPGSIAANGLTTLSLDAYAPDGSHNMNVALWNGDDSNSNGVFLLTNRQVPGWALALYKDGIATTLTIPGGTGTPVSFKVVIDVPNQIVYVVYDFGGGPQTTSSLSLAGDTTLSQWTSVSIFGDYRFGFPQAQIDNILLTQTPKPLYSVCLLYDPTKAVHSGATLPIKLQLCDGTGNDVSSSTLTLHATSINQVSTSISGVVEDSGNANPDNDFRFDGTLGPTGGYIFNLKTTGLATGTYNLNFTVIGDSAAYSALFQVK
jgi:hypothetical protein